MSKENIILHGPALEPNLIGPTLPPIPPFTFPTDLLESQDLPVRQVLLELE